MYEECKFPRLDLVEIRINTKYFTCGQSRLVSQKKICYTSIKAAGRFFFFCHEHLYNYIEEKLFKIVH